ncbi:MAG: 30S ribosomal protein S12 methylthiotransferase RimO [Lachnospiraceae bacterium]|nr:30S ribosomal protein S12 methylthiotransferase RimO [Lachnospiraceae bacterium]
MKLMLLSLGCDKNLVDSEMMTAALSEAGFELTDEASEAEVIVVNTCSFIMDAKEESINALIECGRMKEEGVCRVLIAAGCLAQRYAAEIKEELPEVDALVGTASFDRIVEVAEAALKGQPFDAMEDMNRLVCGKRRLLSTGGHYAYLKIAEGCDKRCSYCAIPSFRGRYRSVPEEILVSEAETLAAGGVSELIVVAQETTVYGADLYGKPSLPRLLKKLAAVDGLNWIRILYAYPEDIDDELIELMATEKKICPYLDLPIQHCEDRILKEMGRRSRKEELCALIEKLRNRIPGIALRTSLITGFPGETEEEFEALKSFVSEMRFDRLGAFAYSAEEGTKAALMPGQIPEELRAERRDEIMRIQSGIAEEISRGLVGKKLRCIVEGRLPEDDTLVLRSYRDAPDVDGYVFARCGRDIMSGTPVEVRITGCDGYDLTGVIEDGGDDEPSQ